MAVIRKTLFAENLENYSVLIQDTDPNSKYFKVTELPTVFTGGKNAFLIQGSEFLVADTIVKIEIKDAKGNVIYHEPGQGIPEYYEGTSKVIAVYVYPDTAFGPCTITILGELKEYEDSNGLKQPIPLQYKDSYNVRWQGTVNVNPLLANTTKIRFYRRPKVEITEQVLPVYNRIVSNQTISGSITATPIQPISGSDFKTFKGILQYELSVTASVLSQSMEGQTITITGLSSSYSPTITDVVSDKKMLVNIPYIETSSLAPNYQIVTGFQNKPFTLTYESSEILSNSNVSSSFAQIKITDLESFSGDPARIKLYASSRQDLGDYQLLEDIQIESSEILLEREFNNQLNVRTGIFTQDILDNFWETSSITTDANISVDNSLLIKSAKLEPITDSSSSVGLFSFDYKNQIEFTKNTEYQLDFTPLLSSSVVNFGSLKIYVSGSAFADNGNSIGKELYEEKTNTGFRRYEKRQVNFKPDSDGTGVLKFVVNSGVWHVSNISLRAAHESAFAPNETTLIADVPTKINNETFDFKLEIYDINNNYVPVTIEQTHTFTGGNDIRIRRDLEITPAFTQFNFTTASAFPSSILIDYLKTGLTGSVTFLSQAVDTTGLLITNADVTFGQNYPGLLNVIDVDTVELPIEAFTGSLTGGKTVGAITYTASCENINRYFTIYRVDQGAPSYLFYATADKYNFTFDPDDNYKSVIADDFIDIRLVKQNLPSIAPVGLTINSASEYGNAVPLTEVGSIGNATIYRLYATSSTHPSSLDGYYFGLGQSTYDFDLTTVDGNFTSSITIDAIEKGDKGKGLIATSDANQFFYKMTDLTPAPTSQTIKILVKRQNLGSLTNTITVTSGSGVPALSAPTYEGNGITSYTISAGNNSETAKFRYNTNVQTYTFVAYDLNGTSYQDQITISPVIAESQISVNLSNENASLPAFSTGFVPSGSFVLTSGSVSVKVGGEDIIREEGLSTNNRFDIISLTGTNCTPNGGQGSNPSDATYGITTLTADSGSLSILVRYKDGRGSTTDVTKVVTYSKAKAGVPNIIVAVTPTSQTLVANSRGSGSAIPSTLTITALEGGVSRFTSIGTPTYTNGLAGSVSLNTISFSSNASAISADTATVTIPVNYTDSENTSGTKTVVATITKSKAAAPTTLLLFSSETQTVLSSSAGYAAPATFTTTLTEGGAAYTYDAGLGSNSTYYISSITGGTNSSGTVLPTTPSSNTGTTTSITVTYKNSEGTTGTLTKTHKVAVSLEGVKGTDGAAGAPGAPGADGRRTATGMIFYQLTSTSAPSTPSATSYTFSSNTFGGLTANWGIGAPTYAAGNSNKYWYSTYTAVETTAGGGTAVPTFSAPAQAINFTGLVTFTSANNITDGTNTSNIVEPGAVTNHIGGANVTTINGGRVSTGVITSTGYSLPPGDTLATGTFTTSGTIFNLDNGSLRSKNFYIASNGDAVFKGTMQIGGVDLTAANTLNSNTTKTDVGLGNVQNLNAQSQAQTGLIAGTTITGGGITLSNGGNIKGGQTAYNTGTGFFLGYEGGAYKFSIGNASSKGVTWDGTTLSIGGDVNIGANLASALTTTTALNTGLSGKISTGGAASDVNDNVTNISGNKIRTGIIESTGFAYTSGNYSDSGTQINLNNGLIRSKNFVITSTGDAIFRGEVNATGGNFSGNITATGTITGGNIVGATLAGATGTFTGTITGTSGQIGGWIIGPNQINDTNNKMKLNSARPAIEIYSGSNLAVDISAATSLTSLTTGTSIPSNVPYNTVASITDTISELSTEIVLSQDDVDPSNNPLFSLGGTLITFGVPLTDAYDTTITLSPSTFFSRAIAVLEPNGGAPAAKYTYLDAFHTIGVSIRAGSSTGTEVGNLSVYVDWSEPKNTTSFIDGSDIPQTLTGVLNLSTGVTYYVVPYIRDGYIGTLVNNYNFDTNQLQAIYRTPQVSAISVSKSISKTELVAGGFQVVFSTDRFCKIERANNADFVSIGGGLTCTGDVTANTSDIRLKENIRIINNPLEKIQNIRGIYFNYTDEAKLKTGYTNGDEQIGFIAQEVQKVLPHIVKPAPFDKDQSTGKSISGENYLTIQYEKIVPLLLEGIKELKKEIEELKKNK